MVSFTKLRVSSSPLFWSLLKTLKSISVRALRASSLLEVWLAGLRANLAILQHRAVPLSFMALDRAQTALWERLSEGWLLCLGNCFKLQLNSLATTWAPIALQLFPCLLMGPADPHLDPDLWTDFLAWPQLCLTTMVFLCDHWTVLDPGYPSQASLALFRYCGTGSLPPRPLPCRLCCHTQLLALHPLWSCGLSLVPYNQPTYPPLRIVTNNQPPGELWAADRCQLCMCFVVHPCSTSVSWLQRYSFSNRPTFSYSSFCFTHKSSCDPSRPLTIWISAVPFLYHLLPCTFEHCLCNTPG